MATNNRRSDIDGVKALAIIAVVLYHMGIATYGYLGVDIFLVISGFLCMNSLLKRNDVMFSFFRELSNRLIRLYPLVLIACTVCLAVGFFTMLPDDYDSLSQSVVATNFSANNVLAYITTGNYWEVVNELKPLMHTWYLGVLVQFYVAILFVYKLINVAAKPEKKTAVLAGVLAALTAVSFLLYCLPVFNNNMKFYMLPFRFFELSAGCIVATLHKNTKYQGGCKAYWTALPLLTVIIFLPFGGGDTNSLRLILTVLCTVCLLLYTQQNRIYQAVVSNRCVVSIGKASFSVYIWHQIILAYTRYTITAKLSIADIIIYLVIVAEVSAVSYLLIEKKLVSFVKDHYKASIAIFVSITILLSGVAGMLYLRAGVVRDIPELDVNTQNISRGMHSKYNHKIWKFEKIPFENNGKINCLIVGNSYARDWANVVLESTIGDSVNISYAYSWDESLIPLIKAADYIFSQDVLKRDMPEYVWANTEDEEHIYGLGTKRFGENNGIIYAQRFRADYHQLTVAVPDSIQQANMEFSSSWGEHYINFIAMVQNSDDTVPVFTQDGKYISQDCWHLTKAGAVMYANLVDWESIFCSDM